MDQTEKILRDAIESGETLTIRYHGGSQPGASREIAPIQITKGKVRARCYASNAVKLFAIGKIEIVETLISSQNEWSPENQHQEPYYKDLRDAYKRTRKEVEDLGYYAMLWDDDEGYSLHYYFKNGNPRKGSVVSISYEEFAVVGSDWLTDKLIYQKKSQRPWVVRVSGDPTRTYKYLDKAMNYFLEQAEVYAKSD